MQRWRPIPVVEKKLTELEARLANALSYNPPTPPDAVGHLFDDLKARVDFLRALLAAERECHGDVPPEQPSDAQARFTVLESAFDSWARSGVSRPPDEEEEEEEEADTKSACSCTSSCFGFECTGQVVKIMQDAAVRMPRRRCKWRLCCIAVGAATAAAVAVGVVTVFAPVGHENGRLIPT